jgi:tRNA-specific 2-thiouridylase
MNKKGKKAKVNNKKTIFVGMSGGVDSSVSAAILKNQGHNVVGVFIRTWHPDFLTCNEEEERRDAMRVCAHLDIPFLTFDFEEVYKRDVADYMISEYKKGRTPNPDVMCNKYVKFGAFLEKAISMGADYVATGHYAINKNSKQMLSRSSHSNLDIVNERNLAYGAESIALNFCLMKGIDPAKDQSYFLWTLKQEQLSKIIFPVGHLNKTEVRKLAKKFNLPVAEKKDSQGICFLGAVDLKEFLKHYIKEKKGKVLNEKGEEIGYHEGVVFYTLGERHGFVINKKNPNDKPYYVIGKDAKDNILYVSQDVNYYIENKNLKNSSAFVLGDKRTGDQHDALNSLNFCLFLENVNWIIEIPKEEKKYTAQIRYHGEFFPCKIKITTGNKAEVIFEKPILVASGQSVVFYDKSICIGGGVII